jgi:hypothetical protein
MVNGIAKVVADYKDWRQDLLDCLGNWCCYCNMPLTDSPQVEHVSPKNPQPGHAAGAYLDWENMVLACGPCNRAKSNKPILEAHFYMPDTHNTHLVFEYFVVLHPIRPGKFACIPRPNAHAQIDEDRAKRTIELCKLDTIKKGDDRATDLRWHYRFEAWTYAQDCKADWDEWGKQMAAQFIPLLTKVALGKGFFSVWLQVFDQVPVVCQALIKAFPGTANCFDVDGRPIPRNGALI